MTISILALEKDLFFSVKMRDTLKHHDIPVTVVRNLAAFEQHLAGTEHEKPSLAIIDTATPGVDWEAAIRRACEQHIPVLAFGSHMDLEARARALQAGAGRVVANSKFSTDMAGIIQRMLSQPSPMPIDDSGEE